MSMPDVAVIAGADVDLAQALRTTFSNRGLKVAGLGDPSDVNDNKGWTAWRYADFRDAGACAAALEGLEEEAGETAVLVYARALRAEAPLHAMSRDQWSGVVEGTLDGAFNVCRAAVPGMRARRSGRIVLISSLDARSGAAAHTNHCAASAGLLGLGKSLARENAALGVTVNMVSPGPRRGVGDDALPLLGRRAAAVDIAGCVAFLTGVDAALITGVCIDLNGGDYMAI